MTELAVAAIIALASITMAVSGFGFALVAVPLLAVVVGAVVVVITVALAFGLRLPSSDATDATDAIAGFASGALATSTGTNGPPLVIALHGKQYPPEQFRATLAAIFLVQSVAGVVLFAAAGRIIAEVGRVSLAGYPAMAAGLLAGGRLATRIDPRRFRGLVLALLATSGLTSLLAPSGG